MKGLPNIPYQLEELHSDHSDRLVFILEGEKDVDRALAAGLLQHAMWQAQATGSLS